MARNAQHASRYLSSVEPSDLAALQSLDGDTLAALLRRVRLAARNVPRADEVESLASLIVGRLYRGDVEKAARAAVSLASRTVDQAYAGVDSLDQWAGEFGDMVESFIATGEDSAGMPRAWCPRPDAQYRTTDADVIAAALDSLAGTAHGRILRDAARAYMAHGDRRCSLCNDPTTAGRRVSLLGILAHTRGLSGSDSEYHVIRRAMLAALRAVPAAALKDEHYYPHAEGGRSSSVFLDRKPREHARAGEVGRPVTYVVTAQPITRPVAHRTRAVVTTASGASLPWEGDTARPSDEWQAAYVGQWAHSPAGTTHTREVVGMTDAHTIVTTPRPTPDTDVVTVTRPDGTRETHTESHYAALRTPRTAEDRLAETLAAAPPRTVRTPQRKRGTGTGAYGSQVGARLSR